MSLYFFDWYFCFDLRVITVALIFALNLIQSAHDERGSERYTTESNVNASFLPKVDQVTDRSVDVVHMIFQFSYSVTQLTPVSYMCAGTPLESLSYILSKVTVSII